MELVDPISLLRDYIIAGKNIDYMNNRLYFSSFEVDLKHPTAWKPKTTKKQYSIGALWFYLTNGRNSETKNYIRECSKIGIEIVSRPDMPEIVSFFTGEVESSEAIDESLRRDTLIQKSFPEESKDSKKPFREVLERPLCTKESLMQTPNISYKHIITYCRDFMSSKKKRENVPVSLLEEIRNSPGDYAHCPILIATSSPTFGININNIKQFLIDSVYVEPANAVKHVMNQPLVITKTLRGRNVNFEVYDQIIGFNKLQWRKVVGVFVQGPRYQFKDWPNGNDMVSLFLSTRGFFLKYNDVPVDDNVKRWNVKILEVHRHKRHLDKTVVNEFWSEMEKFLFVPRPKS